jgi:hypothetical protein
VQLPGKRARLDGVLEEQAGVGGERQRGQVLGRPWRGRLLAGVALGDELGQAAPELPVPLGELGLGAEVTHGVQRELDHEHAEVAGRGELPLGPAAHGGEQLLGRLDGVQRFDLLELSGHAPGQQREEQLILTEEDGTMPTRPERDGRSTR